MIDIDKLVCSLLNYRVGLLDPYNRFEEALKDQGIEYKDGSLHYIGEEIKHKHKVGDWLVENEPNNYARFAQILEIVDIQGRGRYRISRDIHNDEDIVECRFIEKHYHPFNIQNAKPGDVLYAKPERGAEFVVMFKEFNECGSIDSYFRYNSEIGFGVNIPSVLSSKDDHITPATEDQKRLLFSKMEEAGYKWNPDTLTLEKKEPVNFEDFPREEQLKWYICTKDVWKEGMYVPLFYKGEPATLRKIEDYIPDITPTFFLDHFRNVTDADLSKKTDTNVKCYFDIPTVEKDDLPTMSERPYTIKPKGEPDFDGMVDEFRELLDKPCGILDRAIHSKICNAYRLGLQDMWNKLKKG